MLVMLKCRRNRFSFILSVSFEYTKAKTIEKTVYFLRNLSFGYTFD